jgi:hypothetical protein
MKVNFTLNGSNLISEEDPSYTYRICTRKNVTVTKAPQFLVQKTPTERYISSLWSVKPNVYELEFQGQRYTLSLLVNKAKIERAHSNAEV